MQNYGKDRRWPFAEGGGATIGIVSALWAAALLLWRARPTLLTRLFAAGGAVLWALVLYFFRDPDRAVIDAPGLVVSAGDGEVVDVRREREHEYLQAEAIRISTFLSITDVHVQRAPVGGRVLQVTHRPGRFLQAFRPEASAENEHIAMIIETPQGPVLVKQIAGIMARRCVNYVRPGDTVTIGQRFGLIRFGSRVDLFLPPAAEIVVGIGARVKGGITPVAHLASGGHDDTE